MRHRPDQSRHIEPVVLSVKSEAAQAKWRMMLELPGGIDIAADVRPGNGILILFVHGFACGSASFKSAFASPALRGYALCAIDLPGHGTSPAVSGHGDAIAQYAAAVADVVDLLGPDRVALVGHSMGTAVGLLAAARLGDRLGAFVSIEGNLVADDCGLASRGIAEQDRDNFCSKGFEEFVGALESSREADLKAWGSWARSCDPVALHGAARSLVAWSDSGVLAELYRRLHPRTYLYGERGGLPDHLKGTVDSEGAQVIEGSGHFPMIDNPIALWQVVSRSITERPSRNGGGATR
jgi:pimeloyl-ACP methyl ester carboxylesterase